jgi:Ca2+-binding RTX toxin-like protein
MTRVVTDPSTGQAVNNVTGWLDASMVYGSSASVAASLRTADGHMVTSAGNNLPIVDGGFLAGDVRVQENPSLTALQTLFLREHNRQVDLLKTAHPDWTGEQLYQQARAIVTAEIANITYSEFLPHLLGKSAIANYHGYNPTVDASITDEFAGAAYRFGHSIVSNDVVKINEQGADVGPEQSLKEVFFATPADFEANSGADGTLRHLADDRSQALDVRIVDDLRNFLVNPPDGMDLAAINIQRGRDLGLGSLNDTRVALGLQAYTSFAQITADAATAADLQAAYGTVDKIDLWIGGLAETHAAGAFVGQTFQAIIARQFTALRDGDRLWWQNQGFDAKTAAQIGRTTLAGLIELNTDTKDIQPDVFVYYDRHSGTLGGVAAQNPDSPQFIVGSAGADTLAGGSASDILIPAAGTPVLTGGAGADSFVFEVAGIAAVITDFVPGLDRLVLAVGCTMKDVTIQAVTGGSLVSAGGDTILLAGVAPMRLAAHDIGFSL